jgi:hypothetical protein
VADVVRADGLAGGRGAYYRVRTLDYYGRVNSTMGMSILAPRCQNGEERSAILSKRVLCLFRCGKTLPLKDGPCQFLHRKSKSNTFPFDDVKTITHSTWRCQFLHQDVKTVRTKSAILSKRYYSNMEMSILAPPDVKTVRTRSAILSKRYYGDVNSCTQMSKQ